MNQLFKRVCAGALTFGVIFAASVQAFAAPVSEVSSQTLAAGVGATGWQTIGAYRYYFDPQTGALLEILEHKLMPNGAYRWYANVSGTGVQTLKSGDKVYAASDGELQVGMQMGADGYYYFNPETCFMVMGGKIMLGDKGSWMYAHEDGKLYQMSFLTLDGKTYYLGKDCYTITGWLDFGSKKYYFKNDYTMAQNETLIIDGKTYVFDSDGVLLTGWVPNKYDGDLKYYDPISHQVTVELTKRFQYYGDFEYRWWLGEIKDKPANSIATIANGYQVYHERNGWIEPGIVYDGSGTYYVMERPDSLPYSFTSSDSGLIKGNDCFIIHGVGYTKKDNDFYTHAINSSFVIDGTTYYCDENGYIINGFSISDGTAYYYEEDGSPSNGWRLIIIDGIGYEFNIGKATGTRIYDRLYYDGERFFNFDKDGFITLGWVYVNGQQYYFKENGEMATSETLLLDDLLYDFDYNGLVTNSRPYNGED